MSVYGFAVSIARGMLVACLGALPLFCPACAADAGAGNERVVIRVNEKRNELWLFSTGAELLRGPDCGLPDGWLAGSPGTVVSSDGGRAALHLGRLLAAAGSEPFTVSSRLGRITVNPGALVWLEMEPASPLRIVAAAASGEHAVKVRTRGRLGRHVWLRPGEELVVSDTELPEEGDRPQVGLSLKSPLAGRSTGYDRLFTRTRALPAEDPLRQALEIAALEGGGRREPPDRLRRLLRCRQQAAEAVAAIETERANERSFPVHVVASGNAYFSVSNQGRLDLGRGEIFVHCQQETTIAGDVGRVVLKAGAMATVAAGPGSLRACALSGPGQVAVFAVAKKIPLAPGQEALITDHVPDEQERSPADGLGRRNVTTCVVADDIHATLSDLSIVTVLASERLQPVRQSQAPALRRARQQLLKTAAAVQAASMGRGRYLGKRAAPPVVSPDDDATAI